MKKIITIFFLFSILGIKAQNLPLLKVSSNKRFFETQDGKPFFWLGDTGWLLFVKCSREEALHYLDVRKQQGFNVVQAMVLHTLGAKNVYCNEALINSDVSKPVITPGNDFTDKAAYDYWDHVEFLIQEAAKRGIYMALVPIWGSNVKEGKVSLSQATTYSKFLAERFKKYSNIIWLNGGDIPGDDHIEIWKAIGQILKKYDPKHLITFHPRGRYTSSDWFHHESWLDFNMFQSGHRNYAQDTSSKEKYRFGEDNWKYVANDYEMKPVKPTLDGEPSYEHIPYGLHDSLQPRWDAADVRRYAYWSVLAGSAGFTYGNNAIMQFHTIGNKAGSFGVRENWKDDIGAPGAQQMQYLKNLMAGIPFMTGRPAQKILIGNNGLRYNYLLASKGNNYVLVYTYTGLNIKVNAKKIGFKVKTAQWYSPVDGKMTKADYKKQATVLSFDPPGKPANGNDWVLVLKK